MIKVNKSCISAVYYKKCSIEKIIMNAMCIWKKYTETTLATGSILNSRINADASTFIQSFILPDMGGGLTVFDISEAQNNSVVTWYDVSTKTQYWYSDCDTIYMNPDSSGMFMNRSLFSSVDLSEFCMTGVKNLSNLFNGCINLSSGFIINANSHPTKDCILTDMFKNCSTQSGSGVTVLYGDGYENTALNMITTKSTGGNITVNSLSLLLQGMFNNGVCAENKRYIQGKDSLINPIIPEIQSNTVSDYTTIHIDEMMVSIHRTMINIPETTLTLTGGAIGTNYYVIASYTIGNSNGEVSISTTKTEDETHKCIGGFHYGRIRQSFTVSDVVEGIVPNSIWTCTWRPVCNNPDAMVYLGNKLWGDIYLTRIKTSALANGEGGSVYDSSAFGALPGTGTEGFCHHIFAEALSKVGKRLPLSEEFVAAADGSPNGLSGANTNAWSATANRARCACGTVTYAISIFNIVDMVGNVCKWGAEKYGNRTNDNSGTEHWVADVKGASLGFGYHPIGVFELGGAWNGTSSSLAIGSHTATGIFWPENVAIWNGAWAVSNMI